MNPADYEMAFAVIAKKGPTLKLPFFSMVNLKGVVDLLRELQFSVTLTIVENVYVPPEPEAGPP